MPGVCGLACEVCGFQTKGVCPLGDGCVAGTDPRAPGKLEAFRKAFGNPCLLLECAIQKGVNHCTQCDEFPCEHHYTQGFPYSAKLLDMIKGMLGKE
jgi:hypothetical protein